MTPKEECETLLNVLLPAAEHLLKKHGEFYPIGAVLTPDSEPSLTAVDTGNEFPDSQSVINRLIQCHKEMAEKHEMKASGIAWNATIATADGKPSDAIIVSLEHQDGYSVIVGVPYKIGLLKKIKFGDLFAQEGKHDVF